MDASRYFDAMHNAMSTQHAGAQLLLTVRLQDKMCIRDRLWCFCKHPPILHRLFQRNISTGHLRRRMKWNADLWHIHCRIKVQASRRDHFLTVQAGCGGIQQQIHCKGGAVLLLRAQKHPVSYTHLDVYKRQVIGPSGCIKLL